MAGRSNTIKRRIISKLRTEASKDSGRYHIVKNSDGWAVRREGAKRISKVFRTKANAIRGAKTYRSYKGILIVHETGGSFQKMA